MTELEYQYHRKYAKQREEELKELLKELGMVFGIDIEAWISIDSIFKAHGISLDEV